MDGLYLILQLSDSAFPTGGFSHSLGLESFLDHVKNIKTGGKARCRGACVDLAKLRQAFISVLENAGSFSVPIVKASHSASLELIKKSDTSKSAFIDTTSLSNIDEVCEANSSNHIAKRASIRQGKSLIETACLVFGGLSWQVKLALEKLPHGHYPVVVGALLAGLGTTTSVTVSVFMFSVIRGLIATAVRLDVLGAMEYEAIPETSTFSLPNVIMFESKGYKGQGQDHVIHSAYGPRLPGSGKTLGQIWQSQFQELIPDIIDRNSCRSKSDVCLKFPVLDVLQNNQDRLFCKLFYS